MLHLLLAGLCAFSRPTDPPCGDQSQGVVAFVDVTVIPMDRERRLPGQTVVVRGDRIVELGPAASVKVPEGATRVEGKGKFLIPGLAEMHAHIPGGQASDSAVERTLFMYLAGGLTTVRGMLGHPRHLELRARAARGELLSPTIYAAGPSLNGNSIPDPAAARKAVIEQKEAGYDLLKIHPGVSREAFDTLVATARRVGIPFAGHVPTEVGVAHAIESKYATIEHLDGYIEAMIQEGAPVTAEQSAFFGLNLGEHLDESKLPALVEATKRAGVWNVPTQVLMENLVLVGSQHRAGAAARDALRRPGDAGPVGPGEGRHARARPGPRPSPPDGPSRYAATSSRRCTRPAPDSCWAPTRHRSTTCRASRPTGSWSRWWPPGSRRTRRWRPAPATWRATSGPSGRRERSSVARGPTWSCWRPIRWWTSGTRRSGRG